MLFSRVDSSNKKISNIFSTDYSQNIDKFNITQKEINYFKTLQTGNTANINPIAELFAITRKKRKPELNISA